MAADTSSHTTKARGRNVVALHERLRVGLGTLEGRATAGRANDRPAHLLKKIDNPAFKRRFGTDDGQIDGFAGRKREDVVR